MVQSDYIDLIKQKFEINSDAGVGRKLGVSRAAVSLWRNETTQFSPETAMLIAELLEVDPNRIAGDMMAARAKDRKTRNKWLKCGILLPLIFTSIISPITQNVEAQGIYNTNYTLCAYVTRKYHQI